MAALWVLEAATALPAAVRQEAGQEVAVTAAASEAVAPIAAALSEAHVARAEAQPAAGRQAEGAEAVQAAQRLPQATEAVARQAAESQEVATWTQIGLEAALRRARRACGALRRQMGCHALRHDVAWQATCRS